MEVVEDQGMAQGVAQVRRQQIRRRWNASARRPTVYSGSGPEGGCAQRQDATAPASSQRNEGKAIYVPRLPIDISTDIFHFGPQPSGHSVQLTVIVSLSGGRQDLDHAAHWPPVRPRSACRHRRSALMPSAACAGVGVVRVADVRRFRQMSAGCRFTCE